jgi:hypothetical protein
LTSATTPSIKTSLRALLHGAIDYAGTFPPARLPLAAAWSNYVNDRHSPHAWMLAHFVVSAADLPKLGALAADKLFQTESATVAVVGRPAARADEWLSYWGEDLAAMREFTQRAAGRATVAAIEAKLPDDLNRLANSASTSDFVTESLPPLQKNGLNTAALYFESNSLAAAGAIESQIAGIANVASYRPSLLGFKLRAGGLDAAMFPTVEQVAIVIDACRRHQLPWKATAGLHHPIREHRAEVSAPMHGFVNLLSAMSLAAVHELTVEQLAQILADGTASQFEFGDAGLRWNRYTVSVAQIQSARTSGMNSFGSCSFDEPCEDLRLLGWLP